MIAIPIKSARLEIAKWLAQQLHVEHMLTARPVIIDHNVNATQTIQEILTHNVDHVRFI